MSPYLAAGLIALVLVVHMARPRFRRFRISAARFFAELPVARKAAPKLAIANPARSRPLYLHLPLVLLIIAAIGLRDCNLGEIQNQGFGVWILLDTSGSMLVRHQEQTRMGLALAEARKVLAQVEQEAEGREVYLRLSRFDQELVDLAEGTRIEPIRAALEQVQARPLGTDLDLAHQLRAMIALRREGEVAVTHLVVISDMPAPAWVAGAEPAVVWRHVGPPLANVGFSHVAALTDPLSGRVRKLRVSVSAWGTPQSDVGVRITGPQGDLVFEEVVHAAVDPLWRADFEPKQAGLYKLALEPGGAWTLDDQITVRVPDERALPVDWQLPNRALPTQLGWLQDAQTPKFRVMALPADGSSTPTLYLGAGFETTQSTVELSDFVETSPLLADLNFDAVERLRLGGSPLPDGFEPVLRNSQGLVLLAQRQKPLAVYLPGLPRAGDENLANVSTTLFFNSVRFLLGNVTPPQLYQLTQPGQLVLGDRVLAIHPGEGNTARNARSFGTLSELRPVRLQVAAEPIWPKLLVVVVLLFLTERLLAFWGGGRWR